MQNATHHSPSDFERLIRPDLRLVQKPARYIGEELGQIRKDWDSVDFRFCYVFPDLYELGMSYHGREIIYQHINGREDCLCERSFVPGPDMQEMMREKGVALWSLENKRSLREFDAIGISFTFEMAYPSGLLVLDLAGIPLRSLERSDDDGGLLIGRHGATLDALQYLTLRVLQAEGFERMRITLDVGGYRVRREKALRELAQGIGARVLDTGKPYHFEPMSAMERRVVHMTLTEIDGVRTESEGEGRYRHVVVFPERGRSSKQAQA